MNIKFQYQFAKNYDFHCTDEQKHQFFVLPRALFEGKTYRNLTTAAKVLYGFMLDRTLDWTNNPSHQGKQFQDESSNVYVSISHNEAAELLGCARQKASKAFQMLCEYHMIEKTGRSSEYYVLYAPNLLDFLQI